MQPEGAFGVVALRQCVSATLYRSFPEPNLNYHRLRLVSGGTTYTVFPLSSMTQLQATAVVNVPAAVTSASYNAGNRLTSWNGTALT